MASKSGMFLEEDQRQQLLQTLEDDTHHSKSEEDNATPATSSTGCLVCGRDDDHSNLMLCSDCNGEYHIYCLDPPLAAVPDDDWYCPKCVSRKQQQQQQQQTLSRTRAANDDGLADMVAALPRQFTSRFGEVCFAYGGFGFGWWPACVFDPRLTEGSARQTARKNLGKKHLIYFFSCDDAPFAVLSSSKIVGWYEGLAESYHLGKTAKLAGKHRAFQFQQALQSAVVEADKPMDQRLDWNRGEDEHQLELLPDPNSKKKKKKEKKKRDKKNKKKPKEGSRGEKRARNDDSDADVAADRIKKRKPLFCKIVLQEKPGVGGSNVGFVKLASTNKSTFADARKAIAKELVPEALAKDAKWRFHVTTLGPVSSKQEESLGPMLPFLRSGIGGNVSNGGSIEDPITVIVVADQGKA